MKNIKKHAFKHRDPEKNTATAAAVQKKTPVETDNFKLIKKDLRKTVTYIVLFLVTILAFYVADINFSLIEKSVEIINKLFVS